MKRSLSRIAGTEGYRDYSIVTVISPAEKRKLICAVI